MELQGPKSMKIPENRPKLAQNHCIFLHFRKVRKVRIHINPIYNLDFSLAKWMQIIFIQILELRGVKSSKLPEIGPKFEQNGEKFHIPAF